MKILKNDTIFYHQFAKNVENDIMSIQNHLNQIKKKRNNQLRMMENINLPRVLIIIWSNLLKIVSFKELCAT